MYTVYAWKTCRIHAGLWIPLANCGIVGNDTMTLVPVNVG
jgi:hypothetical protein